MHLPAVSSLDCDLASVLPRISRILDMKQCWPTAQTLNIFGEQRNPSPVSVEIKTAGGRDVSCPGAMHLCINARVTADILVEIGHIQPVSHTGWCPLKTSV